MPRTHLIMHLCNTISQGQEHFKNIYLYFTQVFSKSSKCLYLLSHLLSPKGFFCLGIKTAFREEKVFLDCTQQATWEWQYVFLGDSLELLLDSQQSLLNLQAKSKVRKQHPNAVTPPAQVPPMIPRLSLTSSSGSAHRHLTIPITLSPSTLSGFKSGSFYELRQPTKIIPSCVKWPGDGFSSC